MKFFKLSLFAFLMMFTTVGFAQEYDEFDTNNDNRIDENEFNDEYRDYFSEWDSDTDGEVNENEFYETTYNRTDKDQDGYLSENEWDEGNENMYGDYLSSNNFDDYDANNDNEIDNREFKSGFENENNSFFEIYDENSDNGLDSQELTDSAFDSWDMNGNGFIESEEYDTFDNNFLDS